MPPGPTWGGSRVTAWHGAWRRFSTCGAAAPCAEAAVGAMVQGQGCEGEQAKEERVGEDKQMLAEDRLGIATERARQRTTSITLEHKQHTCEG